jgi:uncharacterized iron-regulated membrane protein
MARAALRRLHRWLGFTVGLWAAVAGLSGSLLVFSDAIDHQLAPSLRPAASALPDSLAYLDRADAMLAQTYPDRVVQSFRLPRAAGDPLSARLAGAPVTEVFIDPNSGTRLGERALYGGVMGVIWDLHVHLLAGETGETIAGVLALALLAALLIGLWLWWPRRGGLARALRVRWSAGPRARLADLHSVGGVLTLPLLLIPIITGLMLVFHGPTTSALIRTFGGPDLALPASLPAPTDLRPRQPLSVLVQAGDAALPEARPVSISLPESADMPVVVRQRFPENSHPNGRSFVAVDPRTAEVLHSHSWREAGTGLRIADFKYPLHIGEAFGLPGRLMVLATGLLPLALLITGGWLWWRKRQAASASLRRSASSRS